MKPTIVRIFIVISIFAASVLCAFSQAKEYVFKPDSVEAGRWADSVLQTHPILGYDHTGSYWVDMGKHTELCNLSY